ncbi:sensor histidine kinase [Chitinibacter bivalviorum]|uniref:histidine kinase n=1 Tax=Chitinibacter bivalviorum TaxID=2739434 RepID=A0A7H9BEZ1_9NEIS|nr:sensor histidine kinase [Chitinibacter bivalviorum]QLG87137.1 sensor histidine kinase [Chitinibacter bivalviorum]
MDTHNHATSSLFRRVLRSMALRIALAACLISALSYYYSYVRLQEEALANLSKYIDTRSQLESELFINAESNTKLIRDEFVRRYALIQNLDVSNQFYGLLRQDKDGMWRVKTELDDFEHQATVAALPTAKQTPEFMRQVVLGHQILSQYGPAYRSRNYDTFIDLNVSDANLMYLPRLNYARNGSLADFAEDIEAELVALPERNPSRQSIWTGIYYDKQALEWMVSVITPIDYLGKFIGSVGQDVLLDQLIVRTNTVNIAGTYNMIFTRDGYLIAHPEFMGKIHETQGRLDMRKGAPALQAIYSAVSHASPRDRFIESKDGRAWLGIAPIKGADWLFVTVYPKRLLEEKAAWAASMVLILGIFALAVELGLLAMVLRNDVARPLERLKNAIRSLAAGKSTDQLDLHRSDEIGELARTFNDMSHTVQSHRMHLEELVTDRTQELATRNLQLEAANEALKYLNQEKNELLAIAAHDLKNPVASIQGMAGLLNERLDTWPTEKIKDRLDGIHLLAGRMQRIISNLLDHDALEAGSVQMQFEVVDLDEIISDTLITWRERLKSKQQTANYTPTGLKVRTDRQALWQILDNLISNAVKYSPNDQSIDISANQSEEGVNITVADHGPGIAPHEIGMLFKKFSRLSARPTGGEHTTGLGLSIVKKLVEGMYGHVRCESQFGQGAKFIVTLPASSTDLSID